MTQQQVEQVELFSGERHRFAGNRDFVAAHVHHQPADPQLFLRAGLHQDGLQHVGDILAAVGAGLKDFADVLPLHDVARAQATGEQRLDRVAQDVIASILQPVQAACVGE